MPPLFRGAVSLILLKADGRGSPSRSRAMATKPSEMEREKERGREKKREINPQEHILERLNKPFS